MRAQSFLLWDRQKGLAQLEEDISQAQWVLYFGSREALKQAHPHEILKKMAPHAVVMGCSTGGEILGTDVLDDTLVAIAVTFEHTTVKPFSSLVGTAEDSFVVGQNMGESLKGENLTSVFILSEGLEVNGNELIRGLYSVLPEHVIVTGGFAGDGINFKETEVGLNGPAISHRVAAVGLYGTKLKVGFASCSGWKPFGPPRVITKSDGGTIYEVDNQSVVAMTRKYIGASAKFPEDALFFPLCIYKGGQSMEEGVIRTFHRMDEANDALVFSGDVPEGYLATMMHSTTNELVDGVVHGVHKAMKIATAAPQMALIVSCVGRRLVMGQRVAEEVEVIADALGNVPMAGFYSNGEICHHAITRMCEFHNQTMTITLFSEDR
jgi:hypothetical protein